jgi:hypothetical protein
LPFQTGAGVRIKSLTAIQNGIPIVATQLGVDGLKLIANRHYLQAETSQNLLHKSLNS